MIKLVFLLFLVSYDKLGMSGAQFLQIGMGARAQALAGSYCAIGGDATSIYWNPSGISKVTGFDLFAGYSRWIDGINFTQSSFAIRRGTASYGVQLISMKMDPIEITTVDEPEGTGMYYSASAVAIGGAASLILTDRLSVGFGAKIVREQIYNCSADGFCVDIGSLFELYKDGLALGLVVSNFGTDMQFKGRDLSLGYNPDLLGTTYYETTIYQLPLVIRVGLSYPFRLGEKSKGLLVFQTEHPNDNRERYSFGLETWLFNSLAVRAGYILGHDTQKYSAGFGVNVPTPWALASIDFAYVSRNPLTPQLFLSISLKGSEAR
jgi:hypothetical protein